jgi:hypothetical protein
MRYAQKFAKTSRGKTDLNKHKKLDLGRLEFWSVDQRTVSI